MTVTEPGGRACSQANSDEAWILEVTENLGQFKFNAVKAYRYLVKIRQIV